MATSTCSEREMEALWSAAFLAICLTSTAFCKLAPPHGALKLSREPVDSFKVLENFENAVAISDWGQSSIFQCLSTVRTGIDPQTKTTTYRFFLPAAGLELNYTVKPEDQPGKLVFTSEVGHMGFHTPRHYGFNDVTSQAIKLRLKQNLALNVCHLQDPNTNRVASITDPKPREGMIYYTDYESCVVSNLELHGNGNQCALWAQRELKDNVPQTCIDQFVDICGFSAPPHSRDLCYDGEGDY